MKVVWTKSAIEALNYYCEFIAKESTKNAEKVRLEIINTSKKLPQHPYKYQIDEYYPNNNGSIRRYFKWNYRVVYEITKTHIVVLDVIHTSLNSEA